MILQTASRYIVQTGKAQQAPHEICACSEDESYIPQLIPVRLNTSLAAAVTLTSGHWSSNAAVASIFSGGSDNRPVCVLSFQPETLVQRPSSCSSWGLKSAFLPPIPDRTVVNGQTQGKLWNREQEDPRYHAAHVFECSRRHTRPRNNYHVFLAQLRV